MPRCACASEVYGSVCVCLGCYSCSGINDVQVSDSIGLVRFFLVYRICKIMLRSRVTASFAYFESHCSLFRTVQSKTCPWSVATRSFRRIATVEQLQLEQTDTHTHSHLYRVPRGIKTITLSCCTVRPRFKAIISNNYEARGRLFGG